MENIQKNRLEKVQALMARHNLDAVLVSNCALGNWNAWLKAAKSIPLHLPYNRNNLCLVTKNGALSEYCARTPHPTDWLKYPVITELDLSETLQKARIGLVNPTYLKRVVRDNMIEKYGVEFMDVSDEFHLLKTVKDPEEVEGIAAAVRGHERAFTAVPLALTGEHTEREIAVTLRNRIRELGAECEDLQTSIILRMTSAPDGAASVPEPLPYPGRRVTYGDRVNVQVNGFMPGGYASALGRCYVIGKPSEEAQKYWDLAVKAQHLIAENARPGATVAGLMALFEKEILAPNGLKPDNGNQVYGIGVSVFEAPRNVDSTGKLPLEAGLTLVVAPKIVPVGKDPYCCADVYVVTDGGAKRLGKSPQELIVLD